MENAKFKMGTVEGLRSEDRGKRLKAKCKAQSLNCKVQNEK